MAALERQGLSRITVPAGKIRSCKDEGGKLFSPACTSCGLNYARQLMPRSQCIGCERTDLVSGRLAGKSQCQGCHKVHRIVSADEALLHNLQQRSCCGHLQEVTSNSLGIDAEQRRVPTPCQVTQGRKVSQQRSALIESVCQGLGRHHGARTCMACLSVSA